MNKRPVVLLCISLASMLLTSSCASFARFFAFLAVRMLISMCCASLGTNATKMSTHRTEVAVML